MQEKYDWHTTNTANLYVKKFICRKQPLICLLYTSKTNADSLIGRTAVATKEINNLAQTGEVDIADISWTARSGDDLKIIPAGSKVKICAIEGVKLIVEEIKEEIK